MNVHGGDHGVKYDDNCRSFEYISGNMNPKYTNRNFVLDVKPCCCLLYIHVLKISVGDCCLRALVCSNILLHNDMLQLSPILSWIECFINAIFKKI